MTIALTPAALLMAHFGRLQLRFDGTGVALALASGLLFLIAISTDGWSRQKATIDIASRWNDGEIAKTWAAFRDVVPFDRTAQYTKEDVITVMEKFPRIGSNLKVILNHLDIVAVGYHYGTFQKRQTQHLYGYLIAVLYRNYKPYIDHMRADTKSENGQRRTNQREVWAYLADTGDEFLKLGLGGESDSVEVKSFRDIVFNCMEARQPIKNSGPTAASLVGLDSGPDRDPIQL